MKKYIKPTISVVYSSIDSAVLAAASPNGSGTAGWGNGTTTTPITGGNSGGGSGNKFPGSTSAKDYSYNAWETWDEF